MASSGQPDGVLIDDAFGRIGQFGKAQQKYYILIGFVVFLTSYQYFIPTVVEYPQPWECLDSSDHYHHFSNHCATYERGLCFPQFVHPTASIVSEWNLVCASASYISVPQSSFFFGCMLGVFVSQLCGRVAGRKVVALTSLALLVVVGLFGVGSIGLVWYAVIRFLMGCFTHGASVTVLMWMSELVGPSHRLVLCTYVRLFAVCAAATMPPLAAALGDWRLFFLFVSLGTGAPLIYLSWVPESPCWLLAHQYVDEAENVLKQIASENKADLSEDGLHLKRLSLGQVEQNGFLGLFSHPKIALHLLILTSCWLSICYMYYAVTYALGNGLGGNGSLNFILSFLVEIPAILLSVSLANTYGRRFALSRLMVAAGCCLLSSYGVATILSTTSPILSKASRIGFAILGKASISTAFSMIAFYTAEILPVEFRNVGQTILSVAALFGGALSPFILDAADVSAKLCSVGLLCVGSGLVALKLPETKGRPYQRMAEDL